MGKKSINTPIGDDTFKKFLLKCKLKIIFIATRKLSSFFYKKN